MSPNRPAVLRPILALALAGAGGLAPTTELAAQASIELRHVTTFPESFGLLQTVRPLPDGRVIVADPLGRLLATADVETGALAALGREGRGPGEWQQPDAVYPLPGDSTLLVDLGNTRLTVLDPAGRAVASYPMVQQGDEPGPMGMEIIQPGGVDARGRVYYEARGRMMRPGAGPDSSRVKRWTPGGDGSVDIAGLTPPAIRTATTGGRNNQQVSIRPVPLAPRDAWAVAPDGRVAVVRASPYRVTWIRPEGGTVHGDIMDVPAVRVGTAEKERYLDERDASGLRMEMNVENGVRSLGMQRGGQAADERARAAEIRTLEWPETLPAIRPDALVDPTGRLWVRRYVAVGDPGRYDVFDEDARQVATVRLPAGHRVIGFDGDRVFAVRVDELGLNWLEVFRLQGPAGPG